MNNALTYDQLYARIYDDIESYRKASVIFQRGKTHKVYRDIDTEELGFIETIYENVVELTFVDGKKVKDILIDLGRVGIAEDDQMKFYEMKSLQGFKYTLVFEKADLMSQEEIEERQANW